MGRKSKLSEAQWAEIVQRMLEGEAVRALAREFKISEAAIRERKTSQCEKIKSVANQIVSTERALSELPISAQLTAQNLAAKLRAISENLASAAMHGAATAHRLSALANSEVAKVDDASPLNSESLHAMKGVAVLTKLANDSSSIALNLLAANKETVTKLNAPETSLPSIVVRHVAPAACEEMPDD